MFNKWPPIRAVFFFFVLNALWMQQRRVYHDYPTTPPLGAKPFYEYARGWPLRYESGIETDNQTNPDTILLIPLAVDALLAIALLAGVAFVVVRYTWRAIGACFAMGALATCIEGMIRQRTVLEYLQFTVASDVAFYAACVCFGLTAISCLSQRTETRG